MYRNIYEVISCDLNNCNTQFQTSEFTFMETILFNDSRICIYIYKLETLTTTAYIANIAFICKPVIEWNFLENSQTVFEMREKLHVRFKNECNLTELKQCLTVLLICSFRSMEALPIHGIFRYIGLFSGLNFCLVENCRHLY